MYKIVFDEAIKKDLKKLDKQTLKYYSRSYFLV